MKTNFPLIRASLVAALLYFPLGIQAEDIDIYANPATSGSAPNMLVVIDNSANFSASATNSCKYADDNTSPGLGGSAAGIEQCAIYNAIYALPTPGGRGVVNIGFMGFNENQFKDTFGCGTTGNGGCLFWPIAEMTAENKAAVLQWIRSWQTSGNSRNNLKTNGDQTASAMQEAWAYLKGQVGLSGRNYAGIAPPASCQNSFVVYLANAFGTSGTPGDTGNASPSDALSNAPGVTAALKQAIALSTTKTYGVLQGNGTYSPNCGKLKTNYRHHDGSGNWADEWARYMYQKASITTYTIGMLGASCVADYPALLESMANHGKGQYFPANSYEGLRDAFAKILNEVQAVNSQFSSSSLPVSVNMQGTFLNQIYMGMFRPRADGGPRWPGNLKQYQFLNDKAAGVLRLADANNSPAISSAGTGFISPNAVSFWTVRDDTTAPDQNGGFWQNEKQGASEGYDSPDGEIVEKGGAAQRLRLDHLFADYTAEPGSTSNPRRMYTYCPGANGPAATDCVSSLTDAANAFSTASENTYVTALGATLINWMRGQDNHVGDEAGPGHEVTVRPSIHGDVLHSRPRVVSYGTDNDSEKVVVYYGTNDGVFRAINGNKTGDIDGVKPGGELWSLVLPEFFAKLNRLRENSPIVQFATTNAALNGQPKDYFVDGPTGMYQQLGPNGTVTAVYIYLTMRRGGRFIYALNVTDPSNPKVAWRKSYQDSGMSELGQTWSEPRLALVAGYRDGTGRKKPVIIFGAGYSPGQDSEPPVADTYGRGIFVLDAVDGSLVWSAGPTASAITQVSGMDYAISGDIGLLDRDRDGVVDRMYAADLGGNVWRVDLEPTAGNTPDKWKVSKLAALGCSNETGVCPSGTTPRKFLFQPSAVSIGVTGQPNSYDAVLVASGDREHPLKPSVAAPQAAYNVPNRFYMLKDSATTKDAGTLTAIKESNLFDATVAAYDKTGNRGFYIRLNTGEQAVNAPHTIAGVTHFGTNQPTTGGDNACESDLGTARTRSVNIFTGAHASTVLDGGGLPPTAVSGVVEVNGEKVGFCIGCGTNPNNPNGEGDNTEGRCKSALDADCYTDSDGSKSVIRTYWYKQ